MKKVKVYNGTQNKVILDEAEVADTFWRRYRGLAGKKVLEDDTGIILKPCNSIHTIGMHFAIDVIFLDQTKSVCHMIKKMKPGRFSPFVLKAKQVIEMNSGTIEKTGIMMHDVLEWK